MAGGLCEFSGVDPKRIELIIGTLSKTLASCGGFVGGKREIIEWLRYTLPGFVYSVGLSPVITAAARSALQLMQTEKWRIAKLRDNAELFVATAHEHGTGHWPRHWTRVSCQSCSPIARRRWRPRNI